ncbi:hypothetical protein Y032_0050g1976 [Ancylostoma ceylanicum]|uniref:Uncharacterized protein n=1 Tax=Ancylostoma ceylanicum TaxID=53326 RepID=A0A016U8F1_9BILA|nr:hypothetical protein Y032_0050g1976 [Ancylostoma ceylanicum]
MRATEDGTSMTWSQSRPLYMMSLRSGRDCDHITQSGRDCDHVIDVPSSVALIVLLTYCSAVCHLARSA